jgi:hypothetical protein
MNSTPTLFDIPEPSRCAHSRVKFTLTPELVHYGREDCIDCGKFVMWVAKPVDLVKKDKAKQ